MGILDQIAQPQMADIAGALDVRQKRLDADEAKRKEIRMGQLIAEAIPNLKEGSAIAEMAKNDPKNFMVLSKHLGIPLNAGDQMQQFVNDTNDLYVAAQSDPHNALELAMQKKKERNAQGIETPQLDKFIGGMQQDAPKTMTGLFVTHRTLAESQMSESDKLAREKFDYAKTHEKEMTPFEKAQVAHWNATTGAESSPDMENAITDMATRILAGEDKSKVIGNFGRGAQGAADLRRLEMKMAELRRTNGITTGQQLTNQQDVGAASKAVKDFDTGKQGNNVRSFNTSLRHLDTLGNLADALNNGDTQLINKVGNFWNAQTGQKAPTEFNAAKKIVADEIVKAIVGSGGGVADREEAAKTIDSANSPAQLKGVIATYKELMAGQLKGLKQQYEVSTNRKDFDKYLSDEAKPYIIDNPKDSGSTIGRFKVEVH